MTRLVLATVALVGCGAHSHVEEGAPMRATPWAYPRLGAVVEPADNPSTAAKIELGRLLFHDPVLSGDQATACVTCHSQYWGMGDGLTLGIGVGGKGPAGLGRSGPTTTRRNVPSLWNVGYRSTLFWDGREASLERQVEVPLVDARELGADPDAVIRALAENVRYRALFSAAFSDEPVVSRDHLARAIAAFVRTIVTVDAPYDRFARGDSKALAPIEVRGMFLFADLGCDSCHTPPMFGSDAFYAVAAARSNDDRGRFEVTGDERDRFAFRVPQLRNLRETGPYFHDGHASTMQDAVAEMARATSAISEGDVSALTEFVGKGLMDKSHLPERPLAVPSGLPVPVDGFTIPR